MKGSLLILAFFILGCVTGGVKDLPEVLRWDLWPRASLYVLLLLVGLSIGSDKKFKEIVTSIRPKMLLVPLSTMVGTLGGAALVGLFISKWSLAETLAVGSGFGYYSLSSILIVQLKEASLGPLLAGELGTVALMANMTREMFTLVSAPLLVKYFGKLAPINAGGVTSMDATLPVITRYSGKDLVFLSVFHGLVLDFSVPFFVSFFCSF